MGCVTWAFLHSWIGKFKHPRTSGTGKKNLAGEIRSVYTRTKGVQMARTTGLLYVPPKPLGVLSGHLPCSQADIWQGEHDSGPCLDGAVCSVGGWPLYQGILAVWLHPVTRSVRELPGRVVIWTHFSPEWVQYSGSLWVSEWSKYKSLFTRLQELGAGVGEYIVTTTSLYHCNHYFTIKQRLFRCFGCTSGYSDGQSNTKRIPGH